MIDAGNPAIARLERHHRVTFFCNFVGVRPLALETVSVCASL